MLISDFIKTNQSYFEDFITRSTYHSNAIEGNTLSYADTYAIVFNDNSFKINAQPREIYEAINHKYALSSILNSLDSELTQSYIKDIAIQINKNISEIDGYRKAQVYIRGAEHIPVAPSGINQAMMYLINGYNNSSASIYEKISQFHIEFERIHPFADGNGRTGRLLLNFELLKKDYAPIVIPKEDRSYYFNLLAEKNTPEMTCFFEKLSSNEMDRLISYGYQLQIQPKIEKAR